MQDVEAALLDLERLRGRQLEHANNACADDHRQGKRGDGLCLFHISIYMELMGFCQATFHSIACWIQQRTVKPYDRENSAKA